MRGMVPSKIHTFSEASICILAVVKFWNACPCVDCFLYLPQNTKSPSHHHLPPPSPPHTPFANNILNLVFAYQTLMEKVRRIKILSFHLLFQQNVMSIVVIMKECSLNEERFMVIFR